MRSSRLHPARFANHILVPRRVPDELHISFIDAVYAQNLALRIVRDCRSIPQPGAVKVIFTSTRVPPSSFLLKRQS